MKKVLTILLLTFACTLKRTLHPIIHFSTIQPLLTGFQWCAALILWPVGTTAFAQNLQWVTSYYVCWSVGYMSPDKIDMDALTHVIYSGNHADNTFTGTTSDGLPMRYWNFYNNDQQAYEYGVGSGGSYPGTPIMRQVIDSAHAHGRKALYGLGGAFGDASAMQAIAASTTMRAAWAGSALRYAKNRGFDGVELDWEGNVDNVNAPNLVKAIRDSLDVIWPGGTGTFATALGKHTDDLGFWFAANAQYCDQINLMCYDLGGYYNSSPSHHSWLYNPCGSPWNGAGWGDDVVMSWINHGVPALKLGLGIPFYGYFVSAPNDGWAGKLFCETTSPISCCYSQVFYRDALAHKNTASYHWNDAAKASYISSSADGYWTYDDEHMIHEKIVYAKSKGLGGIMIFELMRGLLYDGSQPLNDQVKSDVFGLGLPSGTFSASPDSLPSTGGATTLTWTSSNAKTAVIDHGIGTVALSGSMPVNVTATTLFTLTLTNDLGSVGYSQKVTVASVEPPSAPTLISPPDGSTGVSTGVLLSWAEVSSATSYGVQISTSPAFSTLSLDTSGLTETSCAATGLANSTTYHWRVSASNSGGSGPWSSPAWSFVTTFGSLSAPSPLAPPRGSTNQPTTLIFMWDTSAGATQYHLRISPDSQFVTTVFNDSTISTNWRQIGPLSNKTTYYWNVRARAGALSSAFSPTWDLTTIVHLPSEPRLHYPPKGASNVPTSVTMSWDTSTDAATYHLQLATDPSFISLVLDDSTLADTSRRVDGLAARTVYYWRVQANNEAGASAWSDPVWEFTTAPSTFVDENGSPDNFSLYQNYPNPFNPRTKITFSVPVASDVRLSVLNLLGQEVTQLVNEHLGAGTYRIEFSGEGLSNGVYFYRMTAGTFTSMRRMILLK